MPGIWYANGGGAHDLLAKMAVSPYMRVHTEGHDAGKVRLAEHTRYFSAVSIDSPRRRYILFANCMH